MPDPNVLTCAWDREVPDAPFRSRTAWVGAHAGAQRLGASVYELEPGGAVSPYHLHHGNEELLVVLAGRPSLRTADGTRPLEPGAVVSFVAGPDGAHRVLNRSDEPARVLLVSTMALPDVAEYPDTGTVLAMHGRRRGWAFPPGTDRPLPEAVLEAMQAAVS